MYDTNNIFAKIIRNEIPSKKVYEDEKVLAFDDITPVAPVHVIVIPKGEYTDYESFVTNAPSEDISHFFKKISEIAKQLNLYDYRVVSNKGASAGQTIFHFHMHIIGGTEIKGLIG